MVPLAIDIVTSELTGRPSPVPSLKEQDIPYYGVKEAVFPFNMFQEVDPVLGPEMRSTGEVLGLSRFYGEAYYKAQEATQLKIPMEGTVLALLFPHLPRRLLHPAVTSAGAHQILQGQRI